MIRLKVASSSSISDPESNVSECTDTPYADDLVSAVTSLNAHNPAHYKIACLVTKNIFAIN